MSKGKTNRFVKLIEKVKRGRADVYHCVLLNETPEEYETIAQGPNIDDRIERLEFDKKEWILESCEKSDVTHYFTAALINRKKRVIDAEFELDHQKFLLTKECELARNYADMTEIQKGGGS